MFSFKYFLIYSIAGFLLGFSYNPNKSVAARRPIDGLFPIVGLIIFGLLIWNFATFPIEWGLLSIGEVFVGYLVGRGLNNAKG